MRPRTQKALRGALLLIVSSVVVAIAMGVWAGGGAASTLEAVSAPATPSAQTGAPGTLEGPKVVIVSELPPLPTGVAGKAEPVVIPRRSPPLDSRAGVPPQPPEPNVVDGAAGVDPQPMAAPAISAVSFEGLDDDDNVVSGTPPDPQLAVGPDHVFEMVNTVGRIFTKTGSAVNTFTLAEFFGVPSGYDDFDPKIIYDDLSGRWFASYVSLIDNPVLSDEGLLHLAISQTSDPTGAWNVYFVTYADVFPDYPGIGVTDDKFTVSANLDDIDGPCAPAVCGEQTIVIQKSDVLSGLPGLDIGIFYFPVREDRATVRPAHSLSAITDQYLTTFSTVFADVLTVIRITGTPDEGNVVEAAATALTITPQLSPPPSTTAGLGDCIIFSTNFGPPPCIESGDFRLLEAIWRDNSLWSAASAACLPSGDVANRSCAHLIEVETVGTPSVVQDMLFGALSEYYSWPAIRTDSSANLYVSLTRTSPSIFAEARIAVRLSSDQPNKMSDSSLVREGDVVHTSGRWGDYLGAAVDPSDASCVWLVGEYAKDTLGANWGTYIAATSYTGGCASGTLDTPTPTLTPTATVEGPAATATSTATATATATPTPTPTNTPIPTATHTPSPTPRPVLRGDATCDGLINAVDALFILQFFAALLPILPCHQNADVNGSGVVDVIDAALILQLEAGFIDSFSTTAEVLARYRGIGW